MTKRLRRQLRLHLENFHIGATLGSALLRLGGLYRRGVHNALALQVNEYDVHLHNLPSTFEGFRVLIMADLHIDMSSIDMVHIIQARLMNVKADICCFLGDYRSRVLGEYQTTIDKMRKIVPRVQVKDGCYGIRGNHDSFRMIRPLSEIGITMLVNQAVSVERDGEVIWLIGVDDPHFYQADDLDGAMNGVPQNGFKILLAHSPEIHWKAAQKGINLYLCGHTHGGQVCSKRYGPIVVNARDSRLQARGFWKYENMIGYTSTGVGTSAIPVRFNCPPEIAVLTFRVR